jgi:hypothetical protein
MTRPSVAPGGHLRKLGWREGRRADRGGASTDRCDSSGPRRAALLGYSPNHRSCPTQMGLIFQAQAEAPVRRGANAEGPVDRAGGPPTPAQPAFSVVGQFGRESSGQLRVEVDTLAVQGPRSLTCCSTASDAHHRDGSKPLAQ